MPPKFIKLSRLMSGKRNPGSVVAIEHGKPVDRQTFLRHVSGLCLELKRWRQGQWLVASRSSYEFAVSLCALWQTGNLPVLPPNLQSGSLEEMPGELCGILSDFSFHSANLPVLSPASFKPGRWKWKSLDSSKISIMLYTSGSTGAEKAVSKTLANLEEELLVLERTFGDRLGECAVLATVSHQHIYGLLFRLLWPLCAGRPFVSETPLLWGELLAKRQALPAVCLASSPVHLDHACAPGRELKPPPGCRAIFSSGAPLGEKTAELFWERWGLPIIEVFGSTETGGVGWRVQAGPRGSALWTPLRGVKVSAASDGTADGRLSVTSPFACASAAGFCALGDSGKVLPDGRFEVGGRIDRIVKVAGKRLSLDEMEARFNLQPGVSRAVLALLKIPGGSNRPAIGAVVMLDRLGKAQLRAGGRLAANKKFRVELKKHFDAVTLPRYFRYVDSLPLNSQGKISHAAVESLFLVPEIKV